MSDSNNRRGAAPVCLMCGKGVDRKRGCCCGAAYCPFCGEPHFWHCPHLVADYRWGRWVIPGVVGRHMPFLSPPPPTDPDLEWSAREYRAALGAATPLALATWRGSGYRPRCVNSARDALLKAVGGACWVPHYEPALTPGTWFSADPARFRKRARAIVGAWRRGKEKLAKRPPAAARQVGLRIPIAVGGGSKAVFAPDGSQLLVAGAEGVELYRVEDGVQIGRVTANSPVRAVAFSPCGQKILVVTHAGACLLDGHLRICRQIFATEAGVGAGSMKSDQVSRLERFGSDGVALAAGTEVRFVAQDGDQPHEWRFWNSVSTMVSSPNRQRMAAVVGGRVLMLTPPARSG